MLSHRVRADTAPGETPRGPLTSGDADLLVAYRSPGTRAMVQPWQPLCADPNYQLNFILLYQRGMLAINRLNIQKNNSLI